MSNLNQITKASLKLGLVLFVLGTTLVLPAQAALLEATSTGSWNSPTRFQGRIGNNALNGAWELRVRGNASNSDNQRTYQSGVTESFSLQHDSATGDLTFALGGDTWVIDEDERTAWNTLGIEIRVRDNDPNLRTLTLENLVYQSNRIGTQSLDNDTLMVTNTAGSDKTVRLTLQDDADWYLSDFIVTGDMTWVWAGVTPTGGDLRFRIGVSDQVTGVPIPGAMWLLTSALGFLGWQHRRKAS